MFSNSFCTIEKDLETKTANKVVKGKHNDHHVNGEQKKFTLGESSLFLVNSREANYLKAAQKAIEIELKQRKTLLSYYYQLAFN